ncbi:MAG: replicative DNA helicase [Bacteroidales bacterium]|nr:replicative DNA helicase [Bacteroidales bacterium]
MPQTTKKTVAATALPDVDLQGRVMPQAVEFEEAVLGAMMLEANAAVLVIDSLREEMFYKDAHQKIFHAIHQLFTKNDPIDLLSVTNRLRQNGHLEQVGGAYYLASLTNRVVSSANIEYHARIVMEKFIQRKLISVSTETIRNAYDNSLDVLEQLDKAEQNLFDIAEQNFHQNHQQMSELIHEVLNDLQSMKNSGQKLRGLPSGFSDLDRITNGWQKGTLNIIAARPGMGKTAFVLSMARNIAAEYQKPLAIFSLEMSATDLVIRLISAESGFKQNQLKSGALNDDDWAKLINSMSELERAKLIIDDTSGLSVFELRAKCRRFKQQYDIQAVIIDYLQLMTAGADLKGNREQEISLISRSLKTLSKELEIPVIALSQLNRGVESHAASSKRPQLSDLRESGAIEQDADIVMFIYRPEYYHTETFEDGTPAAGMAELMIAKHRNGATADVKLRFISDYAKFCDAGKDAPFMTQGILPDSPMTEMPTTQIFNSRINGDKDDIYANDTPQVDYSQDNGDVPY